MVSFVKLVFLLLSLRLTDCGKGKANSFQDWRSVCVSFDREIRCLQQSLFFWHIPLFCWFYSIMDKRTA